VARKAVERFTALIARADGLCDLASQVQDEAQGDPKDALRRLRDDYGTWYADALAVIPPELEDAFRKQYEAGWPTYKVKHFLSSGLEENALLADLVAQGKVSKWLYPVDSSFNRPLLEQKQILRNAAALVGGQRGIMDTLDGLEEKFRSLPVSLAVLRQEFRGRAGIAVADEYDLQRIVHAVLCLNYRDVRPEEYGPSRAGARPRIDFLLKEEQVAVETKMTRKGLGPGKLGDELAADILRYQTHKYANAYFALVYDPDVRIVNSHGFERDFPRDATFQTRVVIVH
jgi:hypothetical protein